MIIFLDIDGVLNTGGSNARYTYKASLDHTNWIPDLIKNLNLILNATNADVVISSSWRHIFSDITWWNDQFKLAGINGTVIDITGSTRNGYRGREVEEWLDANNSTCPYVIIDDDSDFYEYQPRVKVIGSDGLSKYNALEAIDILLKKHDGLHKHSIKENSY